MNLNKIWAVLSRMRDDISNVSSLQAESSVNAAGREVLLTFPDPSSPPVSVMSARRSLRQSDAIVVVTHSTQMIPVLVSLIHSALETTIVREEIDQGTKDARDFGRDARDATRIESERWEQERNSMEVAPKDKSRKLEVSLSTFPRTEIILLIRCQRTETSEQPTKLRSPISKTRSRSLFLVSRRVSCHWARTTMVASIMPYFPASPNAKVHSSISDLPLARKPSNSRRNAPSRPLKNEWKCESGRGSLVFGVEIPPLRIDAAQPKVTAILILKPTQTRMRRSGGDSGSPTTSPNLRSGSPSSRASTTTTRMAPNQGVLPAKKKQHCRLA